jgi:hypothetical protein
MAQYQVRMKAGLFVSALLKVAKLPLVSIRSTEPPAERPPPHGSGRSSQLGVAYFFAVAGKVSTVTLPMRPLNVSRLA